MDMQIKVAEVIPSSVRAACLLPTAQAACSSCALSPAISFACVAICASLSESFADTVFQESVSPAICSSFAVVAALCFVSSSSTCFCCSSAHKASAQSQMRWEVRKVRDILDTPS